MNITQFPQRKNLRLEQHNYSGGDYFITICTRDRKHFFGSIIDGVMHYSPIGNYARIALEDISSHCPYAKVLLYVIMPNHVHAIIRIQYSDANADQVPQVRTVLIVVIGGYKQSVTCFARRNDIDFGWQIRFHDHIIRNYHEGNHIAKYIETNVDNWQSDCFFINK